MIVGVDVDYLEDGRDAVLDGEAGLLIVDPDSDTRAVYCQRRDEQSKLRQAAASFRGPALTATGEPVQVMINVTGLAELEALDPANVDGIGLMRTEFLFQGREQLPTEEEQYRIYKRMVEGAAGKPVTIRTLDAGGDKPIAGLTQPGDLNPFLGVRGVRLSLRHLDVFRQQLRALARAAVAGNLKAMVPMVTVPEELDQCRALLEQAVEDLRQGLADRRHVRQEIRSLHDREVVQARAVLGATAGAAELQRRIEGDHGVTFLGGSSARNAASGAASSGRSV